MTLARPRTKEYTVARINAKLVDTEVSKALEGFDINKLGELTSKMAIALLLSLYIAVHGKSPLPGLSNRSIKPWARWTIGLAIPVELGLIALYARELKRQHTRKSRVAAERQAFEQEVDRILRAIAENRPGLQRRL